MLDNGFTFDGRHSLTDMGVIAIKDKSRTIAAKGDVISYAIGGQQGSLAYGDQRTLQEYTQIVRLYANRMLGSETAATELWRELVGWLCVGRRKLIWDSDPDVYQLAEVTEVTGDSGGWLEEGLRVTLKCQPVRRSVRPDVTQMTIADAEMHQTSLTACTQLPAPVDLDITVTGETALTACSVIIDGRLLALEGLTVHCGEHLLITMELPSGVEILHADGSRDSAMRCCTSFERLEVSGRTVMAVQLTFEGGSGSAQVAATVRGAWR